MEGSEKIIVTAALPYANGDIHVGHLLEYIQADIYSRFLKMVGVDALYICASDMHGTPIEVNAKKAGVSPEKFVEKYFHSQQQDFSNFFIQFDNFYKTHSPENRDLAESFFNALKKQDLIYIKESERMYDLEAKQFLPDRFIKGTCPKCKAADQYGDVCESCGSTYETTDLIKPYSVLTKSIPVLRKTKHYYFKLSKFSAKLKSWINKSDLQEQMKNFVLTWIKDGLQDWCISRDAPYFGFEIPNSKKETGAQKYFYVWLDAPIGYISSMKNYCEQLALQNTGKKKCSWEDYWKTGKVHHFIGKDIAYFHYLFWPAILMAMEMKPPQLTAHGFITVNGKKMSKSRGTFFTAKDFAKLFNPESLRFYYASHLDEKLVDVDLNLADLQAVTNNVMMGNLGNFCFRTLVFAEKNYGKIDHVQVEKKLQLELEKLFSKVKSNYRDCDFKSAIRNILKIGDLGNAYFQKSEAWKDKSAAVGKVGLCVNIARNLAIAIHPVLPEFSRKIYLALGSGALQWQDMKYDWTGQVKKVEKLVNKIEEIPAFTVDSAGGNFHLKLQVGEIIEVKDHPDADKLYVMQVDFGEFQRQIVAGLKKYFTVDDLLGKKAVFLVNLKPAKLRGVLSSGMSLIADDKKKLAFLDPGNAKVGDEAVFGDLRSSGKEISYDEFAKLKIVVSAGKVECEGKRLHVGKVDVVVEGIKDKAIVS